MFYLVAINAKGSEIKDKDKCQKSRNKLAQGKEAAEAAESAGRGGEAHAALVGTEVGPITIPNCHDLSPKAKRVRIENKDQICYGVVFSHEGEEVKQRMSHASLKRAIAAAAQPPSDFTIFIPPIARGTLHGLLGNLPLSKQATKPTWSAASSSRSSSALERHPTSQACPWRLARP